MLWNGYNNNNARGLALSSFMDTAKMFTSGKKMRQQLDTKGRHDRGTDEVVFDFVFCNGDKDLQRRLSTCRPIPNMSPSGNQYE